MPIGSPRRDRDSTSQTVAAPSPVTAASVRPSGEKESALTSPPVSRRGGADRGQVARVQERDALLLEPDRDQPAVGAEPPRVAVVRLVEVTVVGEPERPLDAAVAGEVPGDRRAVVAHRVERLPVGAEDGLPHRVRVPAQRLDGCRRRDVPDA